MVIFKYPLTGATLQEVIMLKDAQILTVQAQNQELFIWALFDEKESLKQARIIEIILTGEIMPNANRKYIATAQISACSNFVAHVFERV